MRGGVLRRKTRWVGITDTASAITTASSSVLFGGFGATELAARPFTIIRARGYISIISDQDTVVENQTGVFAMAVVSDQALAIGVSAVPTPITDNSSDLFFVYEPLANQTRSQSGGVTTSVNPVGREFDSRAMRKVEDGDDIAITIESGLASSGFIFMKMGRLLIKLH